jgi:hypothetical protein
MKILVALCSVLRVRDCQPPPRSEISRNSSSSQASPGPAPFLPRAFGGPRDFTCPVGAFTRTYAG